VPGNQRQVFSNVCVAFSHVLVPILGYQMRFAGFFRSHLKEVKAVAFLRILGG
jgi:hypothetical protein